MAKFIKYQIATEIPHNVVVKVPMLDEQGEPVTVLVMPAAYDENGEVITEAIYEPVFVEEVRKGNETVLMPASIRCATEASLEASLPIAQREAYNGEYTIEGEFDTVPDSTDAVLNTLLGVME